MARKLKETENNSTEMGDRICSIISDITHNLMPNSTTGRDLYKFEKVFVREMGEQLGITRGGTTKVPQDVIDDLEDNNYHTAIDLLKKNKLTETMHVHKKKLKETTTTDAGGGYNTKYGFSKNQIEVDDDVFSDEVGIDILNRKIDKLVERALHKLNKKRNR